MPPSNQIEAKKSTRGERGRKQQTLLARVSLLMMAVVLVISFGMKKMGNRVVESDNNNINKKNNALTYMILNAEAQQDVSYLPERFTESSEIGENKNREYSAPLATTTSSNEANFSNEAKKMLNLDATTSTSKQNSLEASIFTKSELFTHQSSQQRRRLRNRGKRSSSKVMTVATAAFKSKKQRGSNRVKHAAMEHFSRVERTERQLMMRKKRNMIGGSNLGGIVGGTVGGAVAGTVAGGIAGAVVACTLTDCLNNPTAPTSPTTPAPVVAPTPPPVSMPTTGITTQATLAFQLQNIPERDRMPTQEEIDGVMEQANLFYNDVLSAAFPGNFQSFVATSTGSNFRETQGRIAISNIFYDAVTMASSLTMEQVETAIQAADYNSFRDNYVIPNATPQGTTIYIFTIGVTSTQGPPPTFLTSLSGSSSNSEDASDAAKNDNRPIRKGAKEPLDFLPTPYPSRIPTTLPPTSEPTFLPTFPPTELPTFAPTGSPSFSPTDAASDSPTHAPSTSPSHLPTGIPSSSPTGLPSGSPTRSPTNSPTTGSPSQVPSISDSPSISPGPTPSVTIVDSEAPSGEPTFTASNMPSEGLTASPSHVPSEFPSIAASDMPSLGPTDFPSANPTVGATSLPTALPTHALTDTPTDTPTVTTLSSDTLDLRESIPFDPVASPAEAPILGAFDMISSQATLIFVLSGPLYEVSPSSEEIDGIMDRVILFYTHILKAEYTATFRNFQAQRSELYVEHHGQNTIVVGITYDSVAAFSIDSGESAPTADQVESTLHGADLSVFQNHYIPMTAPYGTSLFLYTTSVHSTNGPLDASAFSGTMEASSRQVNPSEGKTRSNIFVRDRGNRKKQGKEGLQSSWRQG